MRFDYFGHGNSEGEFKDGTIGLWKSDTLEIIEQLGSDEVILIGSSMGGWISLLCAQELGRKVRGLVLIAPAPDFTHDLMWADMSAKQQQEVLQNKITYVENEYDAPYAITYDLLKESRKHRLLIKPINALCPTRI